MTVKAPMLKIRRLQMTPVRVPMNYALGTSRARIASAPLLLIDLETEEGVTGRSYLFCYLPAAASAVVKLLAHVEGLIQHHQVSPVELWRKLATHFTLIGVQGIVRMAMAGLDVAAWDAMAIAAGVPLARFLGGDLKPIPAYNSCGLGLMEEPARSPMKPKSCSRAAFALSNYDWVIPPPNRILPLCAPFDAESAMPLA